MAKRHHSVHLSDEAWARLECAAKADDRSISAYLERALMKLPACEQHHEALEARVDNLIVEAAIRQQREQRVYRPVPKPTK